MHRLRYGLVGAVWMLLIASGFKSLLQHELTPGAAGNPPTEWPLQSTLPRDPSKPALLMFVHPQCPCSRASLGELAILADHCRIPLQILVICVIPPEVMPDAWQNTDLWKQAEAIPHVQVMRDERGREATRFGALTSGETLLFDARGKLLFHGGVTASRGHHGDNAGRDALDMLLHCGAEGRTSTNVYGCPLQRQGH